ncbi:MAG: hypothetical protein M3442_09230 [Chloroflexota bacterium]|nr:hypothetical protein [Chloroflexota bacterium]
MAKRVTKGNLWGFIQSRPYCSVADIRRLFLMDVEGAAALATNEGAYYIGLPQEAADMIRQLWQEGRVLLDLNPDVKARVVQGVYPARIPLGRPGAPQGARPAARPASRPNAVVGPLRVDGLAVAPAAATLPTAPAALPVARPVDAFHVAEGAVGAEDTGSAGIGGAKRRRRRKRRQTGDGPVNGAPVNGDAGDVPHSAGALIGGPAAALSQQAPSDSGGPPRRTAPAPSLAAAGHE